MLDVEQIDKTRLSTPFALENSGTWIIMRENNVPNVIPINLPQGTEYIS